MNIEVYCIPPPRKPEGLDQVHKPEKCICERTEMRYLVCTNGVVQYKTQCLKCGDVGQPTPYSSLTKEQRQSAKLIDSTICKVYREKYWREWNAARQAHHEYRQAFWTWHAGYMESDCWKRRRRSVLSRDTVCQSCECRPAVIAHHTTYDRAGREPLFDLKAVCYECHEQIHGRA